MSMADKIALSLIGLYILNYIVYQIFFVSWADDPVTLSEGRFKSFLIWFPGGSIIYFIFATILLFFLNILLAIDHIWVLWHESR